jgi:WD40 repeat protein
MVEVTEETIEQLENIAENDDVPLEEVQEKFKQKYEEVEERSSAVDEETIEKIALRQLRTESLAGNRVPTDEIEMLTIGGDVRETSNGDMFFGTAVVDESPNDDSSSASLGSVRIFDEDLSHEIYDAFDHVGNVVSGEFTVSEGDLQGHVEVSDGDDTEFEVHRPDDRNPLIEEIRSYVPEVSIETIADNLTRQTRGEDGNMYQVSSDIYRIQADVYDGYKNPDTGTGIYTLRDDTVFDEEDIVESPVFDGENANENATPGLTCFFDPNKMEWGSSAIVEFFGTISKNEDGIINFSADGAVPIMPNEDGFDGYTDSEDEDEGSDIERSSGSGSVDRTQI